MIQDSYCWQISVFQDFVLFLFFLFGQKLKSKDNSQMEKEIFQYQTVWVQVMKQFLQHVEVTEVRQEWEVYFFLVQNQFFYKYQFTCIF